MQVLGLQLAAFDHLAQALDDDGLGGDGIGADHLGARKAHALGQGLVTGEELPAHRAPPSGCICMQPKPQALAQMPQPLQNS